MQVRPFQPDDAEQLGVIFYRAVREGARGAYSRSQLEAWAPFVPPASLYERKARDGRALLVTVDADGRPVAYGDLERSGHIDHLFCLPEAIGSGAASRLYGRLENIALEWGLGRIFVEASERALVFFTHKGFTMLERDDFVLRGVLLHHYLMEKVLADN